MADMRVPTRPAPEPPKMQWQQQNGSRMKEIVDNGNIFMDHFKLSRSHSVGKLGGNKKPPPRPPPPFAKSLLGARTSITMPSSIHKQSNQLFTNLFMNTKTGGSGSKSVTCGGQLTVKRPDCDTLIDLSSTPSSPTLTVRSNSDTFSVNSLGSDSPFTGASTGSQIESGFEDDFDLLMASRATTPIASDPWSLDESLFKKPTKAFVPFELSNEDPRCKLKLSRNISSSTSTKPTIIRIKNSKPARPPPPKLRPSSTPPTFVSFPLDPSFDNWSPPMPNCPPPAPPPEVFTTLEHGPSIPPRPSISIKESTEKKKPYCIAIFDYEAGHPDDLSFRVNDVIYLTERVNSDWLRGRLMGKEGIFPASYTKVIVPLDIYKVEQVDKTNYVLALYTFKAETWDDLPFQEGETVKVSRRIDENWLYGECNGRQGQFPENYVTDTSYFFPMQPFNS